MVHVLVRPDLSAMAVRVMQAVPPSRHVGHAAETVEPHRVQPRMPSGGLCRVGNGATSKTGEAPALRSLRHILQAKAERRPLLLGGLQTESLSPEVLFGRAAPGLT
jgi:hypothetical protein